MTEGSGTEGYWEGEGFFNVYESGPVPCVTFSAAESQSQEFHGAENRFIRRELHWNGHWLRPPVGIRRAPQKP